MFESFSKNFESGFRIFFIIWVCFWGVVNLVSLLFQYASFSLNQSNNDLLSWWINTLAQVVTITVGVLLLFIMSNIPTLIRKAKPLRNLGLMTFLSVVYYLFVTIVQIITSAIFKPESFTRDFIFLSAWLFPSIILLVIHMIYISNLRLYNTELEEKSTVTSA